MTPEFQLTLRHAQGAAPTCFSIDAACGASIATSADKSTTVAILAAHDRDAEAQRLADAYARGACTAPDCATAPAGAVILDHDAATTTVVTPPIGLRQVYWAIAGSELRVASNLTGLARRGEPPPAIRPEALFSYVYFHVLPGPIALDAGTSKLDGGHCLSWDGHRTTLTRHWIPYFAATAAFSPDEGSDRLLQILRAAVQESLGSASAVGAFLSGGLDSSTVAGIAAGLRPGLPTVTMGFDAAGYDETSYARIASRHFGTTPLEYYVTPDDVLATLPTIAAAFPEPFGNSSAAAAYHCARIAREHGLERLLAGDGGDELFGGNERYARQLVFERYGRVPATLRKGFVEPLLGAAGKVTQTFPIGKALSYVAQANVSLPDRLQAYNFLHRHDPADVFTPDLLAQVDTAAPLQALRDEFAVPETTSVVDRMLFLDWKFTLHDNDLVKVNTMCDLAGVEVAFPMLARPVIEFSLQLPERWKVSRGELRPFYRRAMRGFLPSEILRKTKHGFGLPFGVWTRTHAGLRRLSQASLDSLGERGCFQREFLHEALRLHRDGHAAYYGELVWILMILELWLQAHRPGFRLN